MRYRIDVTSENPLGDMLVVNAGEQLAIGLDDATNQGSVVVVNAETRTEVTAWRFPADDPPPVPDLDAQIKAGWERLRTTSDALAELTLRHLAADVLRLVPEAHTLRLLIRHPDSATGSDGWYLDDDNPVQDADGRPITTLAPELYDELDGALEDDLDSLAYLEEVQAVGQVNLRTDPPSLEYPHE
jgi:hypothetical protein